MSQKHRKSGRNSNYIDKLFILMYADTRCVSIFCFALLIGIAIAIVGVTVGSKFLQLLQAVIKKLKSVIQKGRKKQQNNILTKTRLNTIEVLVSQTFITK